MVREPYRVWVNRGPHPDESHTWVEGDILEFGGGIDPDYHRTVRFIRLDPDDDIGFYAEDLEYGGISGGWTRGRFRKVE